MVFEELKNILLTVRIKNLPKEMNELCFTENNAMAQTAKWSLSSEEDNNCY